MSEFDIKVVKHPGGTRTLEAEDRTTSGMPLSMLPGEPVKVGGTGNNFVQYISEGDPEAGTDEFAGIVRKESTETAAADGKVEVITLIPNKTVLRGKAHTAANADTAAELLGLMQDWVTFGAAWTTAARGAFTINEDEGSDPNVHGLQIIAGDINDKTLDVVVHGNVTVAPTW